MTIYYAIYDPTGALFGTADSDYYRLSNGNLEIDLLRGGGNWAPLTTSSTHVINGLQYATVTNGSNYTSVYGEAPPSGGWPDDLETLVDDAGDVVCLLGSSLVSTTRHNSRRVDTLQTGDTIMTKTGCLVRIIWVGIQAINTRFKCAERTMPVKIKQGALGENMPFEDLTVTTDHAMLVDGILATAGSLVNGTSITRVPLDEMGESFKVYHIVTENHEIIYANGAPTETFIDNVSRSAFDNYQEYVDLYGEEREMDELPLPRAMSPRQLPKKIKARLAARAEALGYVKKAAA